MSKYILSTMTHSVNYAFYVGSPDNPIEREKIRIHGGASIPSSTSGVGELSRDSEGKPLWTANGVVTTIKDDQWERLKDHAVFKSHLEAGYVKLINHDITGSNREIDKHVATMEVDPFRQLNKDTIKQRVKVTSGTPESDNEFRL